MPVRLSVRLPDWSDGLTAVDEAGRVIDFEPKQGYWQSKESVYSGKTVTICYKGDIVIENRNCQPLSLPAKEGYAGKVVLRYGPELLSLKDHSSVPVLLLDVAGPNDRVVLSKEMFRPQTLENQTAKFQQVALLPREERKDSVKSVFVFDAIICKKIQNK